MSKLDRLRSTQITPRTAVICIAVLVVVLVMVIVTVRKMADTSPAYATAVKPKAASTAVDVKIKEEGGRSSRPASAASLRVARNDDPYAVVVERNLFRPVGSVASAGPPPKAVNKPPVDPPKPPPVKTGPLPPMGVGVPAGNIDEVKKNVAFTGAVQMPTGTQALLENLQTKETRFVSQGDSAFGYRVVTISSQLAVLEKNGLQFTLTLGEGKADAPAAAPKPGEGKPGQPGGPPPDGGRG